MHFFIFLSYSFSFSCPFLLIRVFTVSIFVCFSAFVSCLSFCFVPHLTFIRDYFSILTSASHLLFMTGISFQSFFLTVYLNNTNTIYNLLWPGIVEPGTTNNLPQPSMIHFILIPTDSLFTINYNLLQSITYHNFQHLPKLNTSNNLLPISAIDWSEIKPTQTTCYNLTCTCLFCLSFLEIDFSHSTISINGLSAPRRLPPINLQLLPSMRISVWLLRLLSLYIIQYMHSWSLFRHYVLYIIIIYTLIFIRYKHFVFICLFIIIYTFYLTQH